MVFKFFVFGFGVWFGIGFCFSFSFCVWVFGIYLLFSPHTLVLLPPLLPGGIGLPTPASFPPAFSHHLPPFLPSCSMLPFTPSFSGGGEGYTLHSYGYYIYVCPATCQSAFSHPPDSSFSVYYLPVLPASTLPACHHALLFSHSLPTPASPTSTSLPPSLPPYNPLGAPSSLLLPSLLPPPFPMGLMPTCQEAWKMQLPVSWGKLSFPISYTLYHSTLPLFCVPTIPPYSNIHF